jgi:hypothetical protein
VIVTVIVWSITALLAVFAASGVVLFVQALRTAPEAMRGGDVTLHQRIDRYVGPIAPESALLTPRSRVLVEFVTAACGFPGLGWLISGRVGVGLALLVCGSAVVWGFAPVALAFSGLLLKSPYAATFYLPLLGIVSAVALALDQKYVRRLTR